MNIFSIIGFVIASFVLIVGLRLASDDLGLFFNKPSLFIVIGGTFASTSISFQLNRLFAFFKIFINRVLFGKKTNYTRVVEQIIRIADASKKGQPIESQLSLANDDFLKESLDILNEGILDNENVVAVMKDRNENLLLNNMQEANKIKTVSKFPPAFGMIGTTIGMIVLLANLNGENAMQTIGPAMGICLITTLYGAVLANLLFIPIAENLVEDSKERYLKNKIVVKGLSLIIKNTNPVIVAEELNSFLPPKDRLDWKKVI